MPVQVAPTPNPAAMKFSVGVAVGGPTTFAAGQETDDPMAASVLALDGVVSMFLTADFVTVTKAPDADWSEIVPQVTEILEAAFDAST